MSVAEQPSIVPGKDTKNEKESWAGSEKVEQHAEGEKGSFFLTAELIRSAETLDELISAAYGTEGLALEHDGAETILTYDELRKRIKNVKRYLSELGQSNPAGLRISATELEEKVFGNIPEEEGLRRKAMEIYDIERQDLLSTLDMTVVSANSTKKRLRRTNNLEKEALEAEITAAAENHVEGVIAKYRNALSEAHLTLEDKNVHSGFFSTVARFFGKKTKLSSVQLEELHALKFEVALDLKNISAHLKTLIKSRGGTNDEVSEAIVDLRREIRLHTDKLGRNNTLLDTLTTITYEREIFEENASKYSAEELAQLHRTYTEGKVRDAELQAMVGKFVPAGTVPIKQPVAEKKERGASPDKAIAAAIALNDLKKDGRELDKKAETISRTTGSKIFEGINAVGEWYSKLPRSHKIAVACSIGALMLAAPGIGSAAGAKIFSLAYAGRLAQKTLVGASVTFAVEGAISKSAEKNKLAGKKESIISKNKELLALSAGLAAIVLPRIVSDKVSYLIQDVHVGDTIKGWFHSEVQPQIAAMEIEAPLDMKPIPEIVVSPDDAIPTLPPVEAEPTDIVTEPEAPMPGAPESAAEIVPLKEQVVIDDKLGIRGDSIWGSLKHHGVSERAIANYEKQHSHSIDRVVRHGDKISFIYDKETDTLKEVQLEKAAGKFAKKSVKIASAQVLEKAPLEGEKVITHEPAPAEKEVRIKKNILTEKVMTKISEDDKMMPLPTKVSDENGFLDILDGNKNTLSPLYPDNFPTGEGKAVDIVTSNPKLAGMIKTSFGKVDSPAWEKVSSMKATSVFTKSPEVTAKLFGNDEIARSGASESKKFLLKISKESGIKPKGNESVLQFVTRAMTKIAKK